MGNTFKTGNYVNAIFQDTSNNIGIGGSPSGSYKLEVTGTAKVSSTLLVSGASTFNSSATVTSASTSGFVVNSTNNASYRGFTIQVNGTTQGGMEILPNTGEIRIGGYSTTSDYFPVIYSDGVAALSFGVGATPSATFSGLITGQVNNNTFGTASTTGRGIIVQAGSSGGGIMLKNAAGGDGTIFATGTSTSMNYAFNTYSVGDAFVILNNGNVGIGTVSPRTAATGANPTLDIKGGIYFGSTAAESCCINNDDRMIFNIDSDNTSTTDFFRWATNTKLETGGTELMKLTESGVLTINALGSGTVTATSGVLSAVSDMNLKIEDGFIDNALGKVLNLKPRYFLWKKESGLPTGIRQLGFYAQEVNEALGEEVANTPSENGNWGIYDRGIIAMLTAAIQEQQAIITLLQDRLDKLENK